ncbi:hypothetical protein RIF29_08996 [Crotalaria pallida]|uniref:Uncharacterized protein n=1 Tax=Crotalaria pallida TaxID=3830 RepID=A0AAN9ILL2_CROPI
MIKQMQLRISADGIFGSLCTNHLCVLYTVARLLEETEDKNRRKSFDCVLSRASKGLLISFEVLDFFRAKGASKDPTRVITKVAKGASKDPTRVITKMEAVCSEQELDQKERSNKKVKTTVGDDDGSIGMDVAQNDGVMVESSRMQVGSHLRTLMKPVGHSSEFELDVSGVTQEVPSPSSPGKPESTTMMVRNYPRRKSIPKSKEAISSRGSRFVALDIDDEITDNAEKEQSKILHGDNALVEEQVVVPPHATVTHTPHAGKPHKNIVKNPSKPMQTDVTPKVGHKVTEEERSILRAMSFKQQDMWNDYQASKQDSNPLLGFVVPSSDETLEFCRVHDVKKGPDKPGKDPMFIDVELGSHGIQIQMTDANFQMRKEVPLPPYNEV